MGKTPRKPALGRGRSSADRPAGQSWPTDVDALLDQLEKTTFANRVDAQTALASVAAALTSSVSAPSDDLLFGTSEPGALSPMHEGLSPFLGSTPTEGTTLYMRSINPLRWLTPGGTGEADKTDDEHKRVRERVSRMFALGERIADELHAKQLQVTVGFPFVVSIGLVWERDKTP